MPFPFAAAATAAAGLFGAHKASKGQEEANRLNYKIAKKQMQFQSIANAKAMAFSERMSSTQFQRGMQDMRLAGLNPILAYKQGGASAPSGVTSAGSGATMQNPEAPWANIGQLAAEAVRTGIQAKQARAQYDNTQAQTEATTANAKVLSSTEQLNRERLNTERFNQGQIAANTALTNQRTQTEANKTEISNFEIDRMVAESQIKMDQMTTSELNRIKDAIRTRIYRTGLGSTLIWWQEVRKSAPSLKSLAKKGK